MPLEISWRSDTIKKVDRKRPITSLARRVGLNLYQAEVLIRWIDKARAEAEAGDPERLKRITKAVTRQLERARMYYAAARRLDGEEHTWPGLEKRYAIIEAELAKV